jgi:osmotically inducible protein OsmC
MKIVRRGSAVWQGGLKDGKGTLTTESKVLSNTPYSFGTRFEGAPGTNPEELLGAAHAGCFTMALSHNLGEAGIKPEKIDTGATVTLEKQEGGFSITHVHLDVTIKAPGADRAKVIAAAEKAKTTCPLSKVLRAEISMDAKLAA